MSKRGKVAESPFLDSISGELASLQSSIPEKVGRVDSLLRSSFGKSLAEANAEFKQAPQANAHLTNALGAVREELVEASSTLDKIILWVSLKAPKAEAGKDEFGAHVQNEFRKLAGEVRDKLNTAVDALPSYFSDRAGAVEKIANKVNTELKESKTKTKSTGGKDGDEEKTTITQVEEKTNKGGEALHDQLEHIAAVDMKFYIIGRRNLEMVRSAYIVVHDVLVKNYAKLDKPRESGREDTNPLSMY